MTISVVIPIYNAETTVLACLESICLQERIPDQVILVDNGSTDKTVSLIKDFMACHTQVRFILLHETKKGAAAARNKSLSCLQGDIVAFTDSDCILSPGWIRNILELYERDAADAISGMTYMHNPRTHAQKLEALDSCIPNSLRGAKIGARHEVLFGKILVTCNASCKREVFMKAGGFNKLFPIPGEDTDFTIRVFDLGYRIVVWHPDIVVQHMPRRNYLLMVKKIFQYRSILPRLLKLHFSGTLLIQFPGGKIVRFPCFTGVVLRAQFLAFMLCVLLMLLFYKRAFIIGVAAAGVYFLFLLTDLKRRADSLRLKISLADLLIMAVGDIGKKFVGEYAKVHFGIKTGAFYL